MNRRGVGVLLFCYAKCNVTAEAPVPTDVVVNATGVSTDVMGG